MRSWVIGRGLIGAAVARRLGPHRCWSPSMQITWDDESDRDARIQAAAGEFLDAMGDGPWEVVWCAGAGVAGTSEAGLLAEARAVRVLLDALTTDRRSDGTVFLASSSSVYAGSVGAPFHEGSPVAPLSPYGFTKLDQEQAVAAWASQTGNRVVIGRIANVYGPGQDLSKPQGLVSRVCLSLLLQTPLTLYVPLDTIRDYVYVEDCAAMVVAAVDDAAAQPAGSATVRLIATGHGVTVGHLLDVGRRVVKRRLPVVTVPSGPGVNQASDLRLDPRLPFRSELRSVSLPVGLRRTFDRLLVQHQTGWATDPVAEKASVPQRHH